MARPERNAARAVERLGAGSDRPMTDSTRSTTDDHADHDDIWIDVPGGRLAADDQGEGPPILLVHSAVVNRRAWDGVVPLLVAAGYRSIAYDMRGFGESTSEEVEFTGHEDLLAVLDHFGVGRAAIVRQLDGRALRARRPPRGAGSVRRLRLGRRWDQRLRQGRRASGGSALPGRERCRGGGRLGSRR